MSTSALLDTLNEFCNSNHFHVSESHFPIDYYSNNYAFASKNLWCPINIGIASGLHETQNTISCSLKLPEALQNLLITSHYSYMYKSC